MLIYLYIQTFKLYVRAAMGKNKQKARILFCQVCSARHTASTGAKCNRPVSLEASEDSDHNSSGNSSGATRQRRSSQNSSRSSRQLSPAKQTRQLQSQGENLLGTWLILKQIADMRREGKHGVRPIGQRLERHRRSWQPGWTCRFCSRRMTKPSSRTRDRVLKDLG